MGIGGLARTLNERDGARIGALTPLLALFVLLDISSFWLAAWDERETLRVGWAVMFSGLAVREPTIWRPPWCFQTGAMNGRVSMTPIGPAKGG